MIVLLGPALSSDILSVDIFLADYLNDAASQGVLERRPHQLRHCHPRARLTPHILDERNVPHCILYHLLERQKLPHTPESLESLVLLIAIRMLDVEAPSFWNSLENLDPTKTRVSAVLEMPRCSGLR